MNGNSDKEHCCVREFDGGLNGLGARVHGQHAQELVVVEVLRHVLAKVAQLLVVEGARSQRQLLGLRIAQ